MKNLIISSFELIILTLLVMEVQTDSEENERKDELGKLGTNVDSDLSYAKIIVCTLIFLVALGPPVIYYYFLFYTPYSLGFLRVTSLFYWVLFWLFLPFTIGCSATICNQYSKTLHVSNLMGLIFLPIFWLIILIETWISRERQCISKLHKTKPACGYVQDLRKVGSCIKLRINFSFILFLEISKCYYKLKI